MSELWSGEDGGAWTHGHEGAFGDSDSKCGGQPAYRAITCSLDIQCALENFKREQREAGGRGGRKKKNKEKKEEEEERDTESQPHRHLSSSAYIPSSHHLTRAVVPSRVT